MKTGSAGGDSVVSMLSPVLKPVVFHHLPPVAGVGCLSVAVFSACLLLV